MVAERYFYDSEREEVLTDVDLYRTWEWSKEEEYYPKFADYVEACQWYNNGTLEEVTANYLDDYLERYQREGRRYRIYHHGSGKRFDMADASRALVGDVVENCLDEFDADEYDALYVCIRE